MKIKALLTAMLICAASSATAETVVAATVDGETHEVALSRLTFDNDIVTVHLEDGSSFTADMSALALTVDYDGHSAIEAIAADATLPSGVYNLAGQRIGDSTEGVQPGIYIVNGQKVYVK